ncbi:MULTISPECIES: conjugal transfer protein TraW [spotted fever group]|uniref:Conjugal transfer pilus assembly protein TraW n=1 Tax=Rickettsia tamurae subsp. buchneri TaxID=1462938 RepID=A0A8E0WKG4_9RICK|nr:MULTISPECIES: conjugal transfer protein TraW [spotted fever group]EER20764.1 type-F conjugative transfer system protein TraW [Rickettsia endosymbiont of Ixodes scapularis]KDO02131.1 conjugal transfer pilus assembly protein TraW [Rickettsia tamurae subsp. buchneri]
MKLILGLVILVLSSSVLGIDFGKRGATYKVAEEGFVSMIKNRLSTLDLQQHQEEMRRIAKQQILEPAPVLGIRATSESREFWYDPSFTLTEDIKLPDGKILHKAGTKVNPLDHMVFDRELIFIDGRSQKQVEWLKARLEDTQANSKKKTNEEVNNFEMRIILVGGKILELQEDIGRTLYFDQGGELTNKFGIEQVPAIVVQDGKKLKISEIKI